MTKKPTVLSFLAGALVAGGTVGMLWWLREKELSFESNTAFFESMIDLPELPDPSSTEYGTAGAWSFVTLDGELRTLEGLRGKTVFVNVWATWCVPCLAEMPGMQRLAQQFDGDDDVAFVFVSNESRAKLKAFVKERNWTIPVYSIEDAEWPDWMKVEGYPTTLVIAPDGRIAFQESGASRWGDEPTVEFLRSVATAK